MVAVARKTPFLGMFLVLFLLLVGLFLAFSLVSSTPPMGDSNGNGWEKNCTSWDVPSEELLETIPEVFSWFASGGAFEGMSPSSLTDTNFIEVFGEDSLFWEKQQLQTTRQIKNEWSSGRCYSWDKIGGDGDEIMGLVFKLFGR